MASIFWFADGGGTDRKIPPVLVRWIRTQSPALIVYGGDVYHKGSEAEFALFFDQLGRNVSGMCEVAGNHDWDSPSSAPFPDRTPVERNRRGVRLPPSRA